MRAILSIFALIGFIITIPLLVPQVLWCLIKLITKGEVDPGDPIPFIVAEGILSQWKKDSQ